jgi:phosphoribosylpyrophosphate synthetase
MGLKNFHKQDAAPLVDAAIKQIYQSPNNHNYVLVSPDAGASKKIYSVASQIGYTGEIITCSKHRGLDGKIVGTIVPTRDEHVTKDFIIVDDICDGGATFTGIAQELRVKYDGHKIRIYLVVTHGIFSNGLKQLAQLFDGIYTTNSFRTINSMNEFGMYNEKYLDKVHQVDIFGLAEAAEDNEAPYTT